MALHGKVGEEVERRHKAEEQLEESEHHKSLRSLMQNPAPESRRSNVAGAGRGSGDASLGAGESRGAGSGGASGDASLGAGESGGVGSGGASGEGHAHADKKYGRFPLELRANVDQVRTSSLFWEGLS